MTDADAPSPISEGRQLDAYRRELTLTNAELWLAYFGLGGTATPAQVDAYLAGTSSLSVREHNTLTLALNEAFLDVGADHPIRYIT